jgi:hypothetical protein
MVPVARTAVFPTNSGIEAAASPLAHWWHGLPAEYINISNIFEEYMSQELCPDLRQGARDTRLARCAVGVVENGLACNGLGAAAGVASGHAVDLGRVRLLGKVK